jgi:iron complex outermembrane receptor protein
MKTQVRTALFAGAALGALSAMTPAFAQQTPAASTPTAASSAATIEEVIVTATRRSQSLQDVPMAIDVASGEKLQKLSLFDIKDVQQLSPGLSLTNTGGRNNTATLRGISFDPDSGTSPAVDLYFNEVPTDAQTAFTAMYDVQQIEVLRGPQGALRGRTAPAGAITITTRKPDLDRVTGYVQGTASDADATNLQGAVSVPLIPGKLALRVAGLIDRNDLNQVHNVNRDQDSHSKTESGRVSLAFSPTDDFDAVLTYQYLNADNHQFMQVLGAGAQPSLFDPARSGPAASVKDRIAVSEGDRRYQNRTELLTLTANWDLGGQTLSFVGGHQDSVLRQRGDNDTGNAVPGYENNQDNTSPFLVNTAELRLASNGNAFWNYTVSGYFSRQTGNIRVSQKADSFFANTAPDTPYPASFGLYLPIQVDITIPAYAQTYALAGSSSFQFNDKLKLEVAARYSWIHNNQVSIQTVSSPGLPAFFVPGFIDGPRNTIDPAVGNRHSKALTGGANLVYEFSRDLTAYASYGRSYRDGTAAVSAPPLTSLALTKPEKSDAIELGFKTQLLDRRLAFSADVFYQKFDGYLGRTPGIYYDIDRASGVQDGVVDGQFDFNFNGDAVAKGIEASLTGKLTDAWDFSASAAYVKSRYDNALAPCNDFNGDGKPDSTGALSIYTPPGQPLRPVSVCVTNDRIGETPDFSLTLNSEYRLQWGELQPFVRGLFVYRPGFNSVQANYDYRSRETLNLYAGLRGPGGRWEISLFAKDVLDQQRITYITQSQAQQSTTSVATFGQGAPFNAGYRLINSSSPREVGLTASFNF